YVESVNLQQPANRCNAEERIVGQIRFFLKYLFGDTRGPVWREAREAIIFTGYIIADPNGLNSQLLIASQLLKARASLFPVSGGPVQYFVRGRLLGPNSPGRKRTCDEDKGCDNSLDKYTGSRMAHGFTTDGVHKRRCNKYLLRRPQEHKRGGVLQHLV